MTRGHRGFHRVLWPLLAFVVALGLTLALTLRPPPDELEAPAAQTPAAEVSK